MEEWFHNDQLNRYQPTIGFNRPIEPGLLPTSLTHLTLGGDFNQPIGVGVLPPNLTHLTLGGNFNQPIGIGVLPLNLIDLTLKGNFDQTIGTVFMYIEGSYLTFKFYRFKFLIKLLFPIFQWKNF